ncbi:hypothetical protein IJ23_03215 [Vibrio sp. OY15]|nr:hypothetical protein IJ23_03215 [Vibrio sp. OY15]KXZ34851.1 hypothetical protein A0H77_20640 [Vibrio alginolyticus]
MLQSLTKQFLSKFVELSPIGQNVILRLTTLFSFEALTEVSVGLQSLVWFVVMLTKQIKSLIEN